jgi:hypothetical protein
MTYTLIVSPILVGYLCVTSRPEFAYGRIRIS